MATYTDDFNRANETPLNTGTWGQSGTGSFTLTTNEVTHPGDAGDNEVYYVSASASGDQFSQAKMTSIDASADTGLGVVCRHIGSSTRTFFRAIASADGSITVRSYTGGSGSAVGSRSGTFATNDVLRMEVTGTSPNIVIKVFKNGTQVGADFTGVSGPNTGKPGLCYSSSTPTSKLDDWSGGDLGGTDYTATVPSAAAATGSGPVALVSTMTRPFASTTIA